MLTVKQGLVVLGATILPLCSISISFAQTSYGSQLMSPDERAGHRAMMRSLPPGEQEAYRARHHEAMKERAESMGLSLPEQPPAYRGFGRRGPGYGRYGRGYWTPGYRGPAPWYEYPESGPRDDREGYGPGYGRWGYPNW